MALDSLIYDGTFTSTGANVFIPLRGGVSEIEVWNYSIYGAPANSARYYFKWQVGMPNGGGLWQGYSAAEPALAVGVMAANTGFFYQDTSVVQYTFNNPANPITDIAANGVVSAVAHGIPNGSVIRFLNIAGNDNVLGAIDWLVTTVGGANDADHFTITNPPANLAHDAAPGANAGFVILSREGLYVPEDRVIVSISQAAQAVITFAAPHEFQVGNDVRINVNAITNPTVANYLKATYGASPSLNPQTTVTAINSNVSITVSMNTVAMPAFVFPLTAAVPFTPSQVTPIGQDTAYSLTVVPPVDILGDQPNGNGKGPNIAQIGMLLIGSGAGNPINPAGANGNTMYWRAIKSFNS